MYSQINSSRVFKIFSACEGKASRTFYHFKCLRGQHVHRDLQVEWACSETRTVVAVLWSQFVVQAMLFLKVNVFYFYICTFLRTCTVPNLVVFRTFFLFRAFPVCC